MSSRLYQDNAEAEIAKLFRQGKKKVLLWLATGGGKTVIFCNIVKKAMLKGKRVIIVVRGRKLVDQASRRLLREGVAHGVWMASHWNFRPHLSVQVCSIDTLVSRDVMPECDLMIIDECHQAVTQAYKDFLDKYDVFTVACTATPYVPESLRHIADEIVHPITMQELIDQAYLVPFRYYAPTEPDLDGVRISASTGDFASDQLEDRMVAGQLTGRIVEHWQEIAENRPTICFAVNIHHSKLLVQKFIESGISAEHCEAGTKDKEREEIIKRLEVGKTKIICNVGILCTGVDIPSIGAIILARPTKSYNLFIQQAGRGTRTSPGKANCILLDHAGNIKRHGFPTMERPVNLDGKVITEAADILHKTCLKCFCVYRGIICPECGLAPPKEDPILIEESNEELREIQVKSKTPVEQWLEYLMQQRERTGNKMPWVYHQLLKKFTPEECRDHLPEWFLKSQGQKRDPAFANSPYSGYRP